MPTTPVHEYKPKRGDIVWLDFDPQAGHEQAKRRPALVLSPLEYNITKGLAIFCPLTSKIKGYPFEVLVPTGSGLEEESAILADQVKSLDWKARKAKFICQLPEPILEDVFAKLLTLLT